VTRGFLTSQRWPFLVDQSLCSNYDPWNAKATLQRSMDGESLAVTSQFCVIEPFDGGYFFTCDTLKRCLACHPGLASDKYRATPALS
jgi:hypothetical protein